ncbi:DUF2510 domain-containing protein [Aestuariimicrobium soli]|uniref:DUF2510 domain-containing protein n=1 Tax=Aestuariimicrobium soli TaxID=2035834 RepID=UPI003EBB8699
MSQPGWYPDPSGIPGRFRHWDGRAWSSETTTDPASTPPPGSPGSRGTGTSGTSPGSRWGVWALVIGVLAVSVVVVLLVRGLSGRDTIGEDTNSSTPTVSQWDETSTPTQTPSPTQPQESGGTQQTCVVLREVNPNPVEGDWIVGGGIAYQAVPDWPVDDTPLVDWADDQAGQTTTVTRSWVAGVAVGQIDKADFGTDPRTAASRIFSCEASSQYYPGYAGHTVLSQQAVTIDGRQGWRLTGEVRDTTYPEVKGDRLDIIVLDVGRDQKLAFFKGMSPIDQPVYGNPVETAAASVRVVG